MKQNTLSDIEASIDFAEEISNSVGKLHERRSRAFLEFCVLTTLPVLVAVLLFIPTQQPLIASFVLRVYISVILIFVCSTLALFCWRKMLITRHRLDLELNVLSDMLGNATSLLRHLRSSNDEQEVSSTRLSILETRLKRISKSGRLGYP